MADIDIERRRSPFWPWVVALVAILAVVFIWAAMTGDPEPELAGVPPAGDIPAATTGTGASAPVEEYVRFAGVEAGGTPPEMGREHEYTAEGIRKLSAALRALSEQDGGADAQARYAEFRQSADAIQQDPTSAQHAGTVKQAFTRAADAIGSLEAVADASRLEAIAESIDAGRPLLDQQEQVRSFFREAGQAIQSAHSR